MAYDDDIKTTIIATTTPVAAVSIKLPEFYQADPTSWFLYTEAQFGIRGITNDETKIWHILSPLDAKTSARATRVITTTKMGILQVLQIERLPSQDILLLAGNTWCASSQSPTLGTESHPPW